MVGLPLVKEGNDADTRHHFSVSFLNSIALDKPAPWDGVARARDGSWSLATEVRGTPLAKELTLGMLVATFPVDSHTEEQLITASSPSNWRLVGAQCLETQMVTWPPLGKGSLQPEYWHHGASPVPYGEGVQPPQIPKGS